MNSALSFHALKQIVIEATGLARDTLHLHVGMALMLTIALLFRRSLGSLWPWLAVVLFAILGEYLDRSDALAGGGSWNRTESLKDFLNTIFWPTMLLVLARFTKLLRR